MDFEEAVDAEGDEAMDEDAGASRRKGGLQRDAQGRKVKGRGAAGAQATMQEGGTFESIDTKGGSSKGPMRCASPHLCLLQTPVPLALARASGWPKELLASLCLAGCVLWGGCSGSAACADFAPLSRGALESGCLLCECVSATASAVKRRHLPITQ